MALTNKTPAETYQDLVYVDNSNSGVDSTARNVKGGNGATSSVQLSTNKLQVTPSASDGQAFEVNTKAGSEVFSVNSSTSLVTANGHNVNCQYATFGISYLNSTSFVANTHYFIPYDAIDALNIIAHGTGTDPLTSKTTADTDATTKAASLVPYMWLIPDDITITDVYSIEGADAATGDTTRMHLYSFTFNSGSTSALADGTLLAHNSDVTNAGSEQAYKSTWTVDAGAVAADKVICAFFRSDSVNSDYSTRIFIKYYLR